MSNGRYMIMHRIGIIECFDFERANLWMCCFDSNLRSHQLVLTWRNVILTQRFILASTCTSSIPPIKGYINDSATCNTYHACTCFESPHQRWLSNFVYPILYVALWPSDAKRGEVLYREFAPRGYHPLYTHRSYATCLLPDISQLVSSGATCTS